MKTLFITISIILFSSCSSKTNVAKNNCASGFPGNCGTCTYTANKYPENNKPDDSMEIMAFFWEAF